MTIPTISQCALEVWLASGERSKERLTDLARHYATINGQSNHDYYAERAIAAVKPWQWQ